MTSSFRGVRLAGCSIASDVAARGWVATVLAGWIAGAVLCILKTYFARIGGPLVRRGPLGATGHMVGVGGVS